MTTVFGSRPFSPARQSDDHHPVPAKNVEDIRMRFFHFIQQDDGIGRRRTASVR